MQKNVENITSVKILVQNGVVGEMLPNKKAFDE
jgi:hypothetical protein